MASGDLRAHGSYEMTNDNRNDDLELTLENARALMEEGEPAEIVTPPTEIIGYAVTLSADGVQIRAPRIEQEQIRISDWRSLKVG